MEIKKWVLVSCISTVAVYSTETYSLEAKTIPVFGAVQGSSLTSNTSTNIYILHLGSFKIRQNAIRCKTIAIEKSHAPVHIEERNGIYRVFAGPIHGVDALNQTSRALISGKSITIKTPKNIPSIPHTRPAAPKLKPVITPASVEPVHPFWSRVVTISAGPAWTTGGTTQTFYLQPRVRKTYVPIDTTSLIGQGEIFLGMQRTFNRRLSGQFGLAALATTNASVTGDIWEDANPNFNNFNYDYQLSHSHIAVKSKLLFDNGYLVTPYISGSLGIGFNKAQSFMITPKLYQEIPAPPFQDQTTRAFTYTVGTGIQKALTNQVHLGVG